jgi:hypothetical protein
MLKAVFEKKAASMGDFYIYYKNQDATTFGICTNKVDEDYMLKRIKHIKPKEDEVLLWNWRYHRPLVLRYVDIKQMTPLASVLKNYV